MRSEAVALVVLSTAPTRTTARQHVGRSPQGLYS